APTPPSPRRPPSRIAIFRSRRRTRARGATVDLESPAPARDRGTTAHAPPPGRARSPSDRDPAAVEAPARRRRRTDRGTSSPRPSTHRITLGAPAMNERARSLYDEPELYRMLFDGWTADLDFYRRLAADAKGEILECGVGTGRVAIDLARCGHRVHGVDVEPRMLDRLALTLRGEPLLAELVS